MQCTYYFKKFNLFKSCIKNHTTSLIKARCRKRDVERLTTLLKNSKHQSINKSSHLFYYANHTQRKLVSRWGVGKYALQTSKSSMFFTKVPKFQRTINYVQIYNITNEMHLHDLCESYHLTARAPSRAFVTSTFPIMHLICPPSPKFCISFVIHFSWVLQPS